MINITLGNLIKFHILVSLRLDDAAAAAAGAGAAPSSVLHLLLQLGQARVNYAVAGDDGRLIELLPLLCFLWHFASDGNGDANARQQQVEYQFSTL